jgi:putative intracellular protease/amidase
MNHIRSILFLAFSNAGEQDLLAPWELFKSVAWSLGARGEKVDVTLGSFESGVLTTQMGAKLEMERRVEPTDRYDLVYVPGGVGAGRLSQNAEVLDFLRAHHREGRWVAANCAGVGVLHRAGILAGANITSPATLARRLPAQGSPIVEPRRAWLVDSAKKIFTSGGAATVHPGTIALVTELFGEQQGRELAAAWDTLPLHGEALLSKLGPVMHDDPGVAAGLQDQWENVFLPSVASSRADDAAA